MSCQLSITYSSNYGGGVGTFTVPDGSYQSAYPYWYPGVSNPRKYDVRTDGSQGKIILAGPYTPPDDFYINYDTFSSTCAPITQKYDCINGVCTLSTQYTTPGIYQSLADCQAVCANGGACASGKQCVDPVTFCPDGKVCIDQGEFVSIEALISKIGSEVC
ncbi:hypothetical protein [Nostoc sp.]|uniref:hypothetical protein n=1 Tax=Nostoc sp. TaxID=1180 RepID=UPI002FFAA992